MPEQTPIPRKPEWLKTSLRTNRAFTDLKGLLRGQGLHTVCEEAHCPNRHECWGAWRTASFMILGDICTRRCRFCAVTTGRPAPPDPGEPRRVSESVRRMALTHVHVTMVNRDDLPDGGASLMAATVRAVGELAPGCTIEVLTSDFRGRADSIRAVVESGPDITSHNLETVRRLTRVVRSRSDYDRSLALLSKAKELAPERVTKSSLMLGLGESREEVLEALDDLRAAGVDMVNLGQYLQPSRAHAPVERYWTPEEFAALRGDALRKGFLHCESGPLVRSSYHAEAQARALHLRRPQ